MAVTYYLFRSIAWLVSRLPFPILYLKSDALYLLLYFIFGYRKKVVLTNLHRAFPGLDEKERRRIARRYYRNLCDIILENIKVEGMRRSQLAQRVTFSGVEIIDDFHSQGRAVLLALGHCGNWEWAGPALCHHARPRGFAAVKHLSDPRFNRYMEYLRGRFFPGRTIPFKMTLRYLMGMKDEAYMVVLAADHTPTRQESRFWTTFLNQETPFFEGSGKLAHGLGLAVCYVDIQRVRRGYYHGTISTITPNGKASDPGDILLEYVNRLEKSIQEAPDNWLWSHRRWKHQRGEETLHPRKPQRDIV